MTPIQYCRQIEIMIEEMGYEPPRLGEMPDEYLPKLYKFVGAIHCERVGVKHEI